MRKTLSLARKGGGLTRPNPPVGALVVKNGREQGSGFHTRAGGPHAEVIALAAAGAAAKGATLYVTLEPCSTIGRTPPCTDLIVQSGVSRVVLAVRDPNPKHDGRGIAILKKSGVSVSEGVCKVEGDELIAPFAKWIVTGRPYLTLKLGMSLDGRIADHAGRSKWITCESSRKIVQDIRCGADAVLVGSNTACADDPSLLCERRKDNNLLRIVVDSSGKLPPTARLLNDAHSSRTIVATTRLCSGKRQKLYRSKGVEVMELPMINGHVSLDALSRALGKLGLLHVICEGGGELAYTLVKAGLVDEYVFFVAPRIIGGLTSFPAVAGKGWLLRAAPKLQFISHTSVGADIMIKAVPEK